MPAHRDQSEDRAGPPSGAGPAGAAPAASAVAHTWEIRLPAVLETLGLVRTGLRRRLGQLAWPDDAALDVLLAVNEAVSNAVEHAFPPGAPDGTVEIAAEVEPVGGRRRLRVRIRDTGRWLPRPVPEPDVNRRRGLPMMTALMAEVLIHRGGQAPDDGTTVTLLSPSVPTL
ncbi:ATP-binding protein [Pseudonocardia sp. RS11V-5]|uniref:ATP-binding protein n=1 Tax=Pseudonocardia terrae TaxID=2905831 RepID=UPI001E3A2CE9|nr:ATP-binding protein [Pseudonocardia terrae]MCE3553250.1 ATP-binding protein [Pseudonocardia terrae]